MTKHIECLDNQPHHTEMMSFVERNIWTGTAIQVIHKTYWLYNMV